MVNRTYASLYLPRRYWLEKGDHEKNLGMGRL